MKAVPVHLHLQPFPFTPSLSCLSFNVGFRLFWNLTFGPLLIDSVFICLDL
jgi:hypothetical protein